MKKIITTSNDDLVFLSDIEEYLKRGRLIGSRRSSGKVYECGFICRTNFRVDEWRHHCMNHLAKGNGYSHVLNGLGRLINHIESFAKSEMEFFLFNSERELFQWMLDNNKY
jgi:hypothetical protein